ncbi:MAG TPA: hypothetical protein VFA65_22630 [Bryobacteraceae bacterium]|nr:hypothetical protein [Bryobacteraceae bacterium]
MKAFSFSSIISVVLSSALTVAPVWAQAPSTVRVNPTAEPYALQLRVVDNDGLQATLPIGSKQRVSVEVTDSSGAAVANAAVTCRLPDSGITGTFEDGTHAAVAYTDDHGRATINSIQWGSLPGSVAMRLTATKGTDHMGILVDITLTASAGVQQAVNISSQRTSPANRSQTVVAVPYTVGAQANTQPVVAEPTVSVTKPMAKSSPQPGQTAKQTAAINPAPNPLTPGAADPTVSVTHTSAAAAPHSSHAKWLIVAVVVAAAGAGAAFAMKGKGSSSSTSNTTSTLSIGNPTVSVGHP